MTHQSLTELFNAEVRKKMGDPVNHDRTLRILQENQTKWMSPREAGWLKPIRTTQELIELSELELSTRPGIGPKTLEYIKQVLASTGQSLRSE